MGNRYSKQREELENLGHKALCQKHELMATIRKMIYLIESEQSKQAVNNGNAVLKTMEPTNDQ